MSQCQKERKARTDFTVRALSERLGKTENYLSSVENGREFPSMKTFLRYLITVGFDVSPLTRLSVEEPATKLRAKLADKIYSLDEEELGYLVQQTSMLDDYQVKSKKK